MTATLALHTKSLITLSIIKTFAVETEFFVPDSFFGPSV